jgi:hypothetical protein
LRRLDQELAPTRKAVLAADVKFLADKTPEALRARRLLTASGETFYNTSKLDFCAMLDYPIYTEVDGERIIVDRDPRCERLDEEFGEVLSNLGIPCAGRLDIRAKQSRSGSDRRCREFFAEEHRRRVELAFSREIPMTPRSDSSVSLTNRGCATGMGREQPH